MKRTVITLCAVWLVVFLMAPHLWPSVPYAWVMIGVDALACLIITWRPAGVWQGVIGLSYLIQITIHFARIIRADSTDMNGYWWGLSITALAQLLFIAGWWIHERIGHPAIWRLAHSKAAGARRKSVAR